jgi:hypothetical protein
MFAALNVAGDVIGVVGYHSTEASAFDFEQVAPLQCWPTL